MQICSGEYWEVGLPDDWCCETEDGCVVIHHPDGVGQLEISASEQPEAVTIDDLRYFARDQIEHGVSPADVSCGAFSGIELIYEHDDLFWHEWFLCHENILFLASYTCPLGAEEKEEAMLDVIFATLKPR